MSLNDILFRLNTSGASAATAKWDDLDPGVKASQQMAKTDLPKLLKYANDFIEVGKTYGLPPALLAGIASRESRGGSALKDDGYGANGEDYGMMQVNRKTPGLVTKHGPCSRAHINQAAGMLRSFHQQVKQQHSKWSPEWQLRGAVAAYNFGVDDVRTQPGLDSGTTNDDYSSDIWARAQALAPHFGGGAGAGAGTGTKQDPKKDDSKTPVVPAPDPQDMQGDPLVYELQMLFLKYGYMTTKEVDTGPGHLGPRTQAAMARFLAEKGKQGQTVGSDKPSTGTTLPKEEPKTDLPINSVVELDGVPLYDQGNSKWASEELGDGLLIGPKGCAMTATAMAISKTSGKPINPLELDKYLDGHGGYSGNNIVWDVAARSRGLRASAPAFSLVAIDKELSAGRPVVVGVHYKGDSRTDHWVTIIGKFSVGGSPVYAAHDPSKGRKFSFAVVEGKKLKASTKPSAPGYNAAVPNYITTGELRTFFKPDTKKNVS